MQTEGHKGDKADKTPKGVKADVAEDEDEDESEDDEDENEMNSSRIRVPTHAFAPTDSEFNLPTQPCSLLTAITAEFLFTRGIVFSHQNEFLILFSLNYHCNGKLIRSQVARVAWFRWRSW
jgi:hypothetical protein